MRQNILSQSDIFKPEDIIPVPCNPDCLAMGYALKLGGKTIPLTSMIDPKILLQGTRLMTHFRVHTGLPSGFFGALAVPMAEWKLGLNMDDVSPLREISKLKVPIYLIGGESDDLAPPKGVRELYDAARGEKKLWMVHWAGHADFFSYA